MPKILVIDTEKCVYYSIRAVFKDLGYQVLYAKDGISGLEVFAEVKPDIVFLDIHLRDISGLFLLPKFKALSPSCSLIILARYSSKSDIKQALKLGARAYLIKPFSVKTIINLVSTL